MIESKTLRPGAETLERSGMETAACGRTAISMFHLTTPEVGCQPLRVADILNKAVPMRYLKRVLKMDSRAIRQMIERERRSGTAIVSNNATGYYLAADEHEKSRFVRSMKHRAAQIIATAEAVEQSEVST